MFQAFKVQLRFGIRVMAINARGFNQGFHGRLESLSMGVQADKQLSGQDKREEEGLCYFPHTTI